MSSQVLYAGDGVTKQFVIPFPYIKRPDVVVKVNTITQFLPLHYHFVNDTLIEFATAPTQGQAVQLQRVTEGGVALAQFQDGSVLTEAELNLAVLQLLYLTQELRDTFAATLGEGVKRIATAGGIATGTAADVIDEVTAGILNSQLLADLQARITDINTNAATIGAQVDRVNTLTDSVAALANVNGTDIATFLTNEQTARIDGDVAINETLSLMGAKSGDGLAFVFDTAKVRVSPTESLGTRLAGVQSSLDSNAATIATESTTRATQDSALSTRLDAVSASVGTAQASITNESTTRANADSALSNNLNVVLAQANSNTAAITNESTTRANADGALSTRVDGILATAGNNTALILSEQTTRAGADSSMASSINTLQSGVNGNTASISTQQTVLNGLSAQYMVKLDVNGYVSGFGLYNQGSSSKFYVLADQFAVVTPGKTPTVPFSVDVNGVYMNDAYIRNLVVDKISGGAINSTWNLNNANGRIVIDTGTYMKVIGAGFGANSDLIEWFGVKMAVTSCTKANGITWVGTNGDAYYGGSLRAGVLYNATQSTDTTATAQGIVGPYGTNGNIKTIVLSYTYTDSRGASGSGNGSAATSATIDLYRTIDGGAETKVATLTASGTWTWTTDAGYRSDNTVISGSLTYTDNVAGTANRTYRAIITSRFPGMAVSGLVRQQISLNSTEQ